jgi:hypothetical protein
MSNLISFTCEGCQATLSVPVELAGISGPCPYCATHVTSPAAPAPVSAIRAWNPPAAPPEPEEEEILDPVRESKQWLQAHMMTPEETAPLPSRPRYRGLKMAAGIAVFAGGVASAYHFWSPPDKPLPAPQAAEPATPVDEPPTPRPDALATAENAMPPEDIIPAPSEEIPATSLNPAGSAVAQNVSTAPAAPVAVAPSVPSGPESSLLPDIPPEEAAVTTPGNGPPIEAEIHKVVATGGHLARPGTALVRFFAAKNWQERLQYTLAPEKMKGLMEAYYKTAGDGPIIPEGVELTKIEATEEDSNRKYYAYVAFFSGIPDGVPISVEDTKDGCRVEWRSFIECRDQLLSKFYSGFKKEPQTFRVLVRRGHYFDKDVPNQSGKVVFDIRPPDGTGPWKMWADKNSVAYTRNFTSEQGARWDISSVMVLTLQWEKAPNGAEYVRLRDVVADSWHPDMLPKGSLPN